MPNRLLYALLLVLVCCHGPFLLAQPAAIDMPDPALAPRPRLIVLSGIAAQGSSDAFQTFFLSAERPIGPYQHIGLQYVGYLPSGYLYNFYSNVLCKGGYEIGLFSKFFLHGRLSGRRSHLYYGPQLRFGTRNMLLNEPYPNSGSLHNFRVNTTKVLFYLGGQYKMGHATFEWSLPVGVEYGRSDLSSSLDPYGSYDSGNTRRFIMVPGVALGFRL